MRLITSLLSARTALFSHNNRVTPPTNLTAPSDNNNGSLVEIVANSKGKTGSEEVAALQ